MYVNSVIHLALRVADQSIYALHAKKRTTYMSTSALKVALMELISRVIYVIDAKTVVFYVISRMEIA